MGTWVEGSLGPTMNYTLSYQRGDDVMDEDRRRLYIAAPLAVPLMNGCLQRLSFAEGDGPCG